MTGRRRSGGAPQLGHSLSSRASIEKQYPQRVTPDMVRLELAREFDSALDALR